MSDNEHDGTTRRTFLSAVGAAGAVLGGTGVVGATQQQVATHYRFAGRVAGWQGLEPASIAQAVNPTLNLEPGNRYAVTWKNVDGAPHNIAILGTNGDVLVRTPIISEQGATQTTRFTASEQMDVYLCQVHPSSMRGQVATGGGTTTAATTQAQTETTVSNPTEAPVTETEHPLADQYGENPQKFVARMRPAQGVQTDARGTTYFTLHPPNGVRAKLMYVIHLENAGEVTGAGIYLDRPGNDDPLVAQLYPPKTATTAAATATTQATTGRTTGAGTTIDQSERSLVDSILTSRDLVGPFSGQPLLRLVQAIRNDEVYVEVRTEQHPQGVLRGPIRAVAETGPQTRTTAGATTQAGTTQAGTTQIGTTQAGTTEADASLPEETPSGIGGVLAPGQPGFGALATLGGIGGAVSYLLSRGDEGDE